jgi:two-component system chemotaxis response regulator CheY
MLLIDRTIDVLIVDDYQVMLPLLRRQLSGIGFHSVDHATSATEALGKLREGDYGLVISDWNIRPMSGLELLQEVRSDPRLCSLPFIMVTVENTVGNVMLAKRAGASGYIVKPFSAETLRGKIASVLNNA